MGGIDRHIFSRAQSKNGLSENITGTFSAVVITLLHKIEYGIPVVKHQDQCRNQEQDHKKVQDAIPFTAGVRNILHISFKLMWCKKWRKNKKYGTRNGPCAGFFKKERPGVLIKNNFKQKNAR